MGAGAINGADGGLEAGVGERVCAGYGDFVGEFGFGAFTADLLPGGGESLVEKDELEGGFGLELFVEIGPEGVELVREARGNKDVLGSEPVTGGVAGGALFALVRDGAGGFLRVGAIGFDLFCRGHLVSPTFCVK